MRSSLLPRRYQASRICDACRQRQQQQQQQQQRSITSLSFLASSRTSQARQHSAPLRLQQTPTTRFICHSQALLRSSPSSSPAPSSNGGGEDKNANPDNNATTTTTTTPTPKTHYDLFPKTLPLGPPPTGPFHIDVRALRREYLALQATTHPDRHPPHLKTRAEGLSARVNEAFATLANPFRRAVYVLDLKHEQKGDTETGTGTGTYHADETAKLDDPELLGVVLEAREQVEEAQDESELEPLKGENEERIRRSEEVLEKAFERDDLDEAGQEVVRLRYWVNIKESIDNWERGKPVVLEH